MAKAGKDPIARVERDRARRYQARRDFHTGLERRRTRDNVIAGVAGGLLVLGLAGAQIAYYTVGPASPAAQATPTPTVAATPSPVPTESATPSPSATEAP